KYDGSKNRGLGLPSKAKAVKELIVCMARVNMAWGYTRIQGALTKVGFIVAWSTVRRVLLGNGLDPAPVRKKGMSWKRFLELHWYHIGATDFFTMEVMTPRCPTRYLVLYRLLPVPIPASTPRQEANPDPLPLPGPHAKPADGRTRPVPLPRR